MKSIVRACLMLLFLGAFACAAQDVVNAVHGPISKLNSATRTAVVKTKDGAEHAIKVVDKTTVDSAEATESGAKDAFHGLTEGAEVVAHYTTKGTENTAVEIDKVGKDGIKSLDGTITHIDHAGKTMTVKAEDGTEHTFRMSDHAAADAGKDIAKGTEKSAKVTVYYTEDAGKKVAHFFEKVTR